MMWLQEGEIWPNSQAEITVTFHPEEASSYSRAIYCDVTGRETRLPLKIKGEGLGPKCRFSFDTLDIQNVFVNSAHAYEVILENKGSIEAAYSLLPPTTLFGPNFTFAPSSGVVHPGKLQAIQISFRSNELGEFDEEFRWQIEGAPRPLTLGIRGVVIGPTFQFDQTQLKFGTVSYGNGERGGVWGEREREREEQRGGKETVNLSTISLLQVFTCCVSCLSSTHQRSP